MMKSAAAAAARAAGIPLLSLLFTSTPAQRHDALLMPLANASKRTFDNRSLSIRVHLRDGFSNSHDAVVTATETLQKYYKFSPAQTHQALYLLIRCVVLQQPLARDGLRAQNRNSGSNFQRKQIGGG